MAFSGNYSASLRAYNLVLSNSQPLCRVRLFLYLPDRLVLCLSVTDYDRWFLISMCSPTC